MSRLISRSIFQLAIVGFACSAFAYPPPAPAPEQGPAFAPVAPQAPVAPGGKFAYGNERGVFAIDTVGGAGSANYTWFDNSLQIDSLQFNPAIAALNNPAAPGGVDPVYTFKVAGQNWWWSFSLLPFQVPGNPAQLYRIYYSPNGTTFFRFLTNNGTRRVDIP